MVDRFERFTLAITEISKYWHKIASAEMEKYGLKGPHAMYLVTMQRYAEGVTATQLGELCGKDKADVSRAITMMEKKGLIMRPSGNQNSYRALLKLTAEGEKAAKFVQERATVAVELAGKDLSDETRKIFYDTLEYIASNLQMLEKEGLPQ